jgi:hypothetical protein
MVSDWKMKVSKTETITRLSDRNDINATSSRCHPLNIQSYQGQQTQEHTIHQRRKEARGAPYIPKWFGPGEWVKLKSNVVWLDMWYLKGLELRLACSKSKWSLKGNMINLWEKDVSHHERRSVWYHVGGAPPRKEKCLMSFARWAWGVPMVMEECRVKLSGKNSGWGALTGIEGRLCSTAAYLGWAAPKGEPGKESGMKLRLS